MIQLPDKLIEMPVIGRQAGAPVDVLTQVLDSLRLSGGVILEGRARGDWCVSSHLLPQDVAELFPVGGPVIAYHYVQTGQIFAKVEGQPAVAAGAGSMLIFPHNDRHQLYTSATQQPLDAHEFVTAGPGGVARIEIGGEGPEAEFLTGFLGIESPGHPLMDSLPPLLAVDVTQAQDEWLDSTIKLLKGARQAPEAVAQVAEMAFRHAVQSHVAGLRGGDGGWLSGLNDPNVAKALSVIHARFAEDLDLEELARQAALSRSALGERFVELLGEPPMRYCARWRMRVAANMLRAGKESSSNIAYAVGFNSEAAFNRAFKREFAVPPVTWKRRVADQQALARKPAQADDPEKRLRAAIRSQRTGSCLSKDGSCIGFSAMGEGYPTLMPAVWYHRIESDWSSPVWRHWLAEGIDGRRLIRSDIRGSGLSERHPTGWSFGALYEDFEAVAEEIGAERFDVLAFSHSVNIALAYAARHPHRVRKLALIGGYARGYAVRGDEAEIKRRETLIEFARNYQTGDGGVFAQMLGSLYWPGARGETVDWFGERLVTIMDLDEEIMDVFRSVDVMREIPSIRAETLVMHSRGDRVIGFGCSKEIAEAIPGARLVELDSDNHVIIGTEPAWESARRELRAFLRETDKAPEAELPRPAD